METIRSLVNYLKLVDPKLGSKIYIEIEGFILNTSNTFAIRMLMF